MRYSIGHHVVTNKIEITIDQLTILTPPVVNARPPGASRSRNDRAHLRAIHGAPMFTVIASLAFGQSCMAGFVAQKRRSSAQVAAIFFIALDPRSVILSHS